MSDYKVVNNGKTLKNASKAIIVLHGRGGTAEDIISLTYEFSDDTYFVAALQAPDNTWYPYNFMQPEDKNEPKLSQSLKAVKDLIDTISLHISTDKIYIMGFSQGACMALETTTRYATKYAGVVAFTGGLIGHEINRSKYHGDFQGTKVFIGNSDVDPHVPVSRCEESRKVMESLGADVTLKIYPNMPHTIIEDEITWVKEHIFSQKGVV